MEPQLERLPLTDHPDLVADPVRAALAALPAEVTATITVAEIDPDLADTAALCAAFDLPLAASGNCVLVTGSRGGEDRSAAVVVRASERADINNVVRRRLDVRKVSFTPHEVAVEVSGMEYGGITPIGLPSTWPVLVDEGLLELDEVCIGSGLRRSKLFLPGPALAALPGAEVLALVR